MAEQQRTTFGALAIGEKFSMYVQFIRRKVEGVKVSDTHALCSNDKTPKRVGHKVDVTRINN